MGRTQEKMGKVPTNFGVQQIDIPLNPELLLMSYVTLGNFLNFSKP